MRISQTAQGPASQPAPKQLGARSHSVGSVVALVHPREDDGHSGRITTAGQADRGLWDPASGRFDLVRLRAAIVSRGWTVADFAATAGMSRACLYNVLRTRAASDRTAIRIATTLATREPLSLLAGPSGTT